MSRKASRSGENGPATNGNAGNGSGVAGSSIDQVRYVSLSQETRRRYLNYALSVITSRALPDVRDGLKPVQRRILYVMYQELRLTADAKTRKSAKVCGDTTGNYHPHGESAVYDAVVRLAQDFSLRYPLVHGQGNFGSVIGLPAAAPRYTEVKLTAIAEHLMSELRAETVDMRLTYDAAKMEPVVLPARYPNLLVNGTQGIAVGMATNIPPHNLGEVVKACTLLIHEPDATVVQLMKHVKGPDFPLGGRIVTDRKSIREAYEEGRGSLKIRAEWKVEKDRKTDSVTRLVIGSLPYGVETGPLLSTIGDIIHARKLPQLVGVADECDEKHRLRIVLDIKPGSDPHAVMAYLFRHTALEQNFAINTTCLAPDEHGALVPMRLSLKDLLQHFLNFRFQCVTRRFEYQLRQLERRIHILEGFATVFKGLEQALKIIRASQGKEDAAARLMKAFPLDAEQTNAVLELALYRISALEIDRIRAELAEKRAEADNIRKILASKSKLWKVVETELDEVAQAFGDERRTALGSQEEVAEFDPQAYIVRENTNVVLTRDGWIKRVGRLQKVESTRVREGDRVLAVLPGNTLEHVVIFSSDGVAYTLPIDQVPASSGYGDPLSKLVRVGDGARAIWAASTDPRFTPADSIIRKHQPCAPHLLIATRSGQVMRLSFSPFRTPSTKAGRRFCRLRERDSVVFVELVTDAKTMFLATRDARVIHFKIEDAPILGGSGKGVRGIKLAPNDEVLGAVQLVRQSDAMHVINAHQKTLSFGQMKYGITSRGGKGIRTSTRTGFKELIAPPIQLVDWEQLEKTED